MAPLVPDANRIRSFRDEGLAFRTDQMKTAAGQARRIAALVSMLAGGETIVPERRPMGVAGDLTPGRPA